ncbi:MAG: hypothetical protein AAF224_02065 [Pseudomonadota bacterium]
MNDPLLVQYKVLSDQMLHFSRLYWQSIAFLFALVLGAVAVFRDMAIVPYAAAIFIFAAICGLMGFVVDRLRKLEKRYENALEAIETALRAKGHSDIQIAPKSGAFGARFVVTMGLFVLSAALFALGAFELFGG